MLCYSVISGPAHRVQGFHLHFHFIRTLKELKKITASLKVIGTIGRHFDHSEIIEFSQQITIKDTGGAPPHILFKGKLVATVTNAVVRLQPFMPTISEIASGCRVSFASHLPSQQAHF